MSDLVVESVVIEEIKPHNNADKLEIAVVGGWEIIVGKNDNYKVGDLVVHVQPDALVPREWADTWGVSDYLSWKGAATSGRVRAARLRGVISFGFLVPNESNAKAGAPLAEHYGITKWEPPVVHVQGQARRQHPHFHRYTNIQNLRNHKNKLDYTRELVVTEKIHGTNSRIGIVRREDNGKPKGIWNAIKRLFSREPIIPFEFVVGSHNVQRTLDSPGIYGMPLERYADGFDRLLKSMCFTDGAQDITNSVIVFGEIYGPGVQDLDYGAGNDKGYQVFDIAINGKYVSHGWLEIYCKQFGWPMVPVLYVGGNLTFDKLVKLSEGSTTLKDATHIREGVVVRPFEEDSWKRGELDPNSSRDIFKVISGDYLTRKDGTENH